MKKWMSRYWVLPAIAGLALIMVAALLSSSSPGSPGVPGVHAQQTPPTSTPTATRTPTPTATVNPACQLKINKTVDDSTVPLNGIATFTIEVSNDGNGDCADPQISDVIPDNTDCEDATVASSSDITDINIDGCDSSGTVTWDSDDDLNDSDTIVLTLELSFESDVDVDDDITNEACATSSSDVGGDCDSARVTAVEEATSTPPPTATRAATVQPIPTVIAPPPIPTARPLATIAPPITGTGPDGGSGPLVLGLGLVGVCLLLVSGAAMVKRTR